MGSKLNENIDLPNSGKTGVNVENSFTPKITETIGRGEDARNSFVYITIKWAFIAGCIITGLIVINHWCFRKEEMIPNITRDIQIIWDIVVPIITLALGYAFGKSRD